MNPPDPPDTEADGLLRFGIWELPRPQGWELEPWVGLHRRLPSGPQISLVLSDEAVTADETLESRLRADCELVDRLYGVPDRRVEQLKLQHADEPVFRVRQRLQAEDGTELDILQVYLRVDGCSLGVVTCTAIGGPVDATLDVVEPLLASAGFSGSDTDGADLPVRPFPAHALRVESVEPDAR